MTRGDANRMCQGEGTGPGGAGSERGPMPPSKSANTSLVLLLTGVSCGCIWQLGRTGGKKEVLVDAETRETRITVSAGTAAAASNDTQNS